MDEADVLGDRIAIMSEGELQCYGSSFFLKKKYGAGYRLIIDKSSSCDVNKITDLLRKYISDVQVNSNIGSELRYILDENHSSVFQMMLKDLEDNTYILGINSYGISLTNLDEVFLKARSDSNMVSGDSENTSSEHKSQIPINMVRSYLTGWSLMWNQVLAMLIKRGLSLYRSWFHFIILNLITILHVVITFFLIRFLISAKDWPLLKIDIDTYNDPIITSSSNANNAYQEKYASFVKNKGIEFIDWKQNNFSTTMLSEYEKNLRLVRWRYPVGATFQEDNLITAWYNGEMYHTAALSLQIVMNTILHTEVSEEHNIFFNNHPWSSLGAVEIGSPASTINQSFGLAINLGFAVAIVSAYYIMFYIKERACNSKHLQLVSGVGIIPFWLTAYLCDMVSFTITAVVAIITLICYQEDGYKTPEELGCIFLAFIVYGHAVFPMNYLLSYLFKTPTAGYVKAFLINGVVGTILFTTIHGLKSLLESKNIFEQLNTICLFMPVYSFSTSVKSIGDVATGRRYCEEQIYMCTNFSGTMDECITTICGMFPSCCSSSHAGYFNVDPPGITLNIIISFITGCFFMILVLAIDYRLFEKLCYNMCSKYRIRPYMSDNNEDLDVLKERNKIMDASKDDIKQYSVVMQDVTKYYNKNPVVNRISLGLSKNECFGLLGANGAGKTTTFKIMTGDIRFSHGEAWINGLSLKNGMNKIFKFIGYCPQFDALLDDLTCKETMIMISLIRGLTLTEAKLLVETLAQDFDFVKHLHKRVKQLSGGNKRKLSTAIAIIGDPEVLYLDEPTTGMDPATKRYLWKALCKIRDSGKCIVLTSHSMEECEALCTRLAIMVNGSFKCLGSTQHLKNRFAIGYSLIIKMRKLNGTYEEQFAELNNIEQKIFNHFKGAKLLEKHMEMMAFHLTDTSQKWSDLFGIMEDIKATLPIEDYSLGQSTLEQVFLSFTKNVL